MKTKKNINKKETKKYFKRKTKKLVKKNVNSKCIDIFKKTGLPDVKYLENPICNFCPLYEYKENVKENVVACCFFKMRSGGYKYFNKYVNGIKYLCELVDNELNDFVVKLFIDYSIYEDKKIMSILNNIKNIKIVLFSCKYYCVGKYHLGTFGTIVRMFPIFNLPNNDNNIVILEDIDYDRKIMKSMNSGFSKLRKVYNKKELDSVDVYFQGDLYKQHLNILWGIRHKHIINDIKIPYPYMWEFIFLKKINFNIMKKYLITSFHKKKQITPYYKKLVKYNSFDRLCDDFVCYGFDEQFSSIILIEKLIKDKKSLLINIHIDKLKPFELSDRISNKHIRLTKKFNNYINFLCQNTTVENKNLTNIEKQNYIKQLFKDNKTNIKKFNYEQKIVLNNLNNLFEKMLKEKDTFLLDLETIKIYCDNNKKDLLKYTVINGYNNNLKEKNVTNIF
jgi:hypothetical protein